MRGKGTTQWHLWNDTGSIGLLPSSLAFMAVVVMREKKFRRYRLFGRFWRSDWPRFKGLLRLGLPIAGILAFEVTIFNAAALLMGLIDADSLAAHDPRRSYKHNLRCASSPRAQEGA